MFYYINGACALLETDKAVIDCGGVGYLLSITKKTYDELVNDGCIDAGGQGLVYIMEGMLKMSDTSEKTESVTKKTIQAEEITYIYCTEFLINNAANADIENFRSRISRMGDCTAAAKHSGIIKVHIHTNRPDTVLETALEIGELSDIKIDNMKIQAENGAAKWNLTQA